MAIVVLMCGKELGGMDFTTDLHEAAKELQGLAFEHVVANPVEPRYQEPYTLTPPSLPCFRQAARLFDR